MWGNSRSSSVAALVVVLFKSSLVEAAVTGDEIIRKMQESFGKHKTFSVHFEKDFYWALLDTKQESRNGRIFTRRTGDFRVELEKGDLIVGAGSCSDPPSLTRNWSRSPPSQSSDTIHALFRCS